MDLNFVTGVYKYFTLDAKNQVAYHGDMKNLEFQVSGRWIHTNPGCFVTQAGAVSSRDAKTWKWMNLMTRQIVVCVLMPSLSFN